LGVANGSWNAERDVAAAAVKEAVLDLITVNVLTDDLTEVVYAEGLSAFDAQGIV
jgi:hypothetical protein